MQVSISNFMVQVPHDVFCNVACLLAWHVECIQTIYKMFHYFSFNLYYD